MNPDANDPFDLNLRAGPEATTKAGLWVHLDCQETKKAAEEKATLMATAKKDVFCSAVWIIALASA